MYHCVDFVFVKCNRIKAEEQANIRKKLIMIRFAFPFTSIISGPSCSGKSTWVCQFINNSHRICDKKIEKVIWCHSELNSRPREIISVPVEFVIGVPDEFDNPKKKNILYVVDDLMNEHDKSISNLFTKGN